MNDVRSQGSLEVWPTTVDNPFDPFTQWDKWYAYDTRMGYDTCGTLARIMRPSNELAPAEDETLYMQACNTLLEFYAPNEVYVLVSERNARKF